MSESKQKVLTRVRPPRVKITYDVETGGAIEKKELPFIVGIFADLSGDTPTQDKPAMKDRKMTEIDKDNFDLVMDSFHPGITFAYTQEGNSKKATLGFSCLNDFSPLAVTRRFKPLLKLYNQRTNLRDVQSRIESDDQIEEALSRVTAETEGSELRDALIQAYPAKEDDADPNPWADVDISTILTDHTPNAFKNLSPQPLQFLNESIGTFVNTLLVNYQAEEAKNGPVKQIDAAVATIDNQINQLLNQVIHAPQFSELEASWRGLHYLVSRAETGSLLKLRVFNVSFTELKADLDKAVDFDQSLVFKNIYEAEYGTYGGAPYSLLLGDFAFDPGSNSMGLLKKISEVAASAHAPFLSSVTAQMFGIDHFEQLGKPRDLAKKFESPELNEWMSFRGMEDSRYIALTLPKVLLRLPYGRKSLIAEGMNFEEDVLIPTKVVYQGESNEKILGSVDTNKCLWGNPAYILAERITHAFSVYRWTAAIRGVEGGGIIESLPNYTYNAESGDIALLCPTQVAITDRREKELNDLGFIAACHCKGTNKAAFFGGQTANLPKKYLSDAANSNAQISAMLPYVLAASRFAHYIKVIMREKVGSFLTRANVEQYLNAWVAQYILLDDDASQDVKAAYPLRQARIDVTEIPGKPGAYNATMFLKPHFQLEELTTSIRLVAEIPA